jgi:carbonic anhydrase
MPLLEAIIAANEQALARGSKPELTLADHADSLPLAALTCIDARLNKLIPEMLGVPEEKFIWLRNAGNIITGPTSSTMRSLALACAVKGAKEITVIGHSDCLVAKHSTMQLLDSFAKLGVSRAKLPENISEFFGIFASERQNVIKACDIIRSSPLIGAQVPVHGLLMDVSTGKLEWLVNGYNTLGSSVATDFTKSLQATLEKSQAVIGDLQDFKFGEMKLPETKIGEVVTQVAQVIQQVENVVTAHPTAESPRELVVDAAKDFVRHIVRTKLYKVIGDDKKIYGPISGEKLLHWLAEERIDPKTPVQVEGSSDWGPLSKLGELVKRAPIPLPPPLTPKMGFKVKRPGQR